jgi:hypothetical protein
MTIHEAGRGSAIEDTVVRLHKPGEPSQDATLGTLTCVILGKRFGYCNYSHISFTARIITTAAFKTPAETDAAVARALLEALMPPLGSADVFGDNPRRTVWKSGRTDACVDRGSEAYVERTSDRYESRG